MSPAGISALLLLAFAGFAALAWRKLRIVRALRPEPRWGRAARAAAQRRRQRPAPAAHGPARLAAGRDARRDLHRLSFAAAAQAPPDRDRLRRERIVSGSVRRPVR